MPRAPTFFCDREEQARKLETWVLPDETLYCVLDMKGGGTGFLGVTDRRLIFQDNSFLAKHRAMVSLPLSKINVFASEDSGTFFMTSTLMIVAGSQTFTFDFRGAQKASWVSQFLAGHIT